MTKRRKDVRDEDIAGLKYFRRLLPLFERLRGVGCERDKAGNRSDPLQDELKHYLHDENALGPIKYVEVYRFGPRKPIGKRATPSSRSQA